MKTSTVVIVAWLLLGLVSIAEGSAALVIDFYSSASQSEPTATPLTVSFFDSEEPERGGDVRLARVFTPATPPPGVRRTRIFTPAAQPPEEPLPAAKSSGGRPVLTYQVATRKRLGWRVRQAIESRVKRRRQ